MSYENFKRTIIIPQGQFQEFLQLGNKDRTQMLKELFNLEKFELFYKVTSLESKNNQQIQNIKGQLQQLGEIDPEQIKEKENLLQQLKKDLHELEEKIKIQQQNEAQFQQLLELNKKLEAVKIEFKILQNQEPDFIQLEKTTQQYEKCVLHFKNLLEAFEISAKKITEKNKQIETDNQKLTKVDDEISRYETNFKRIKLAFDNRESLKQKAQELEKINKINSLNKSITNEKERLKKGKEIVIQTSKTVEKLTSEKQIISEEIKIKKTELPDLSVLSEIKTWYFEKQNFDKQLKEIIHEQNYSKLEIEKLTATKNSILKTTLFDELSNKDDFHQIVIFSQSKIDSLKKVIKKLQSEADHLRVKVQLEKYATSLRDGTPCPLCGSVHHPEIYIAENIHNKQKKIESQISVLEKQIDNWNDLILQLKETNNQLSFKTGVFNDWKRKQEEIQKQANLHQTLFKWPEYKDLHKVEEAFKTAGILQQEIKNKEKLLEKLGVDLDETIKNKEKYQKAIEEIGTQITIHETETKTLFEQLKIILIQEYSGKSNTEIENEKSALLKQYSNLENEYNHISNLLTELRKSKDTLSGMLSANREVLKLETENRDKIQNQLQAELDKTDYINIEEIKSILSKTLDIEYNKKKVNDFRQTLILAKSRIGDLTKEIGGRNYDAESHQTLISEINENKQLQNTKNQEKGKTEEELKKLRKNMTDQAVLLKEAEKLELRSENIKTLKSLFKGSGFVNYISSVYLQNLCNTANERFFKLTRQKLSLEITEDNNFQVRDFMNGGKVRNVKTLSGGQTFQAALSLALALADNIQKITESNQNFFFLDEGFGSLDKESLSVVFDTLKSLRSENRIVGVISHVEEMQQEIDVHLRIDNNDETGSLIFNSWSA